MKLVFEIKMPTAEKAMSVYAEKTGENDVRFYGELNNKGVIKNGGLFELKIFFSETGDNKDLAKTVIANTLKKGSYHLIADKTTELIVYDRELFKIFSAGIPTAFKKNIQYTDKPLKKTKNNVVAEVSPSLQFPIHVATVFFPHKNETYIIKNSGANTAYAVLEILCSDGSCRRVSSINTSIITNGETATNILQYDADFVGSFKETNKMLQELLKLDNKSFKTYKGVKTDIGIKKISVYDAVWWYLIADNELRPLPEAIAKKVVFEKTPSATKRTSDQYPEIAAIARRALLEAVRKEIAGKTKEWFAPKETTVKILTYKDEFSGELTYKKVRLFSTDVKNIFYFKDRDVENVVFRIGNIFFNNGWFDSKKFENYSEYRKHFEDSVNNFKENTMGAPYPNLLKIEVFKLLGWDYDLVENII